MARSERGLIGGCRGACTKSVLNGWRRSRRNIWTVAPAVIAMIAPLSVAEKREIFVSSGHRTQHQWRKTRRRQLPGSLFTLQDFLPSASSRLSPCHSSSFTISTSSPAHFFLVPVTLPPLGLTPQAAFGLVLRHSP